MKKSEVKRKMTKLKKLNNFENKMNKQIEKLDKKVIEYDSFIKSAVLVKNNFRKQVSNNMKQMHKILNELTK